MLKKSIILSTVLVSSLVVADDSAEAKALKKGMPQDVAEVIDRTIQCNRWQGEDPSTKERAERVNKELEKWQCKTITQDQDALSKLYKNNYEVKKRIQDAQYIF
jgi:basic membrane lipoprotein Med (substrate-binding protein (PBP1-ABC) superfamily)